MTIPVLRDSARAALRLFCHPERSEGSAFCLTARIGSASIWPIATNKLPTQSRPRVSHAQRRLLHAFPICYGGVIVASSPSTIYIPSPTHEVCPTAIVPV